MNKVSHKMRSARFLFWVVWIVVSIFLPREAVFAVDSSNEQQPSSKLPFIQEANRSQQPLSKPSPTKDLPLIIAELEEKIADSFAETRCTHIHDLASREQYSRLRPLIRAVIAFCAPTYEEAEALFQEAEHADPANDLVWMLHARYRWKIAPDSSELLWRQVLLTTRSLALKRLAKEYLEGTVEETEEAISLGHVFDYFIFAQTGVSRETNPLAQSLSEATDSASNATNVQLNINAQRSIDFGSISLNYTLINSKYFSQSGADLTSHSLEAPLAFHVDNSSDLIIRTFGNDSFLGHNSFQSFEGIGVIGWMYRSTYNQSVQGSVFRDQYYPVELQAQQGLHYKLEYNWEFYPASWFLHFLFYFEHVNADVDQDQTGVTFITYSHNDLNLQFFIEYNFRLFILGFNPKFLMRQDSNDSTYQPQNVNLGNLVTKRRQDYQIVLQPTLTIPLSSKFSFYTWYEFNRIFSNIGPGDYQDRNILNHTLGVALKTYVGSNL